MSRATSRKQRTDGEGGIFGQGSLHRPIETPEVLEGMVYAEGDAFAGVNWRSPYMQGNRVKKRVTWG